MAPIKYPIGIQTFEKIRTDGFLYVDKTEYVWNMVRNYQYVFLSRPRRFGKSLLVSTLDAYFRGRRELFEGLAIERHEKDWTEYPVLRFDLSAANYTEEGNLERHIGMQLSFMEADYGKSSEPDPALPDRFWSLIRRAYESTGQKVVILIDEYDKPLLSTIHDDDRHECIRAKLQAFYSVLKACDEYIRYVFITGVTKFAHVSIFSGLNNLKDISMLPKFNAICGITEKELTDNLQPSLATFAEDNGIPPREAHDMIKASYDGYHFSSNLKEDVYNPFSLINAFDDSGISDYWFSTGTPSYIPALLRKKPYLLENIAGSLRSQADLTNISVIGNDIVPLLFQAGYLTIKDWLPDSMEYVLDFPNEEVRHGFWDSLRKYYITQKPESDYFNINLFIQDVGRGEPEAFMVRLKSLFASIESDHEPDKEVHFRNMMVIVAKMCGFRTRAEVHTSEGRCDMKIETSNYVYIFEFKIDSSAEEAITQIEQRGYAVSHEADPRHVFLIGADFSTKTRTLTDWIIRELH